MKTFATIQALRALAANMVVLFHFVALNARMDPTYIAYVPTLSVIGAAGVHLFFVISGFVITTVAKRENWSAFLFFRITRIYPIYWVYLGLTLIFFMSKGWPETSPTILKAVFLLPDHEPALLSVGWSLVHEVYFYAVMATAIALRIPRLWALLAWASIIIGLNASGYSTSAREEVVSHLDTLDFIAGGLIALIPIRKKGLPTVAAGLTTLVIGIATVSRYPLCPLWLQLCLIGAPSSLLVYGSVAIEQRQSIRIPRAILMIGNASYSIYLGHFILLAALTRHFGGTFSGLSGIGLACACIALANLFGILSFKYIETRIINWSRTIASPYRSRVMNAV